MNGVTIKRTIIALAALLTLALLAGSAAFAEGCTRDGMEVWVLVQNPWNIAAEFSIPLYTDQGQVSPDALKDVVIGPMSRASFRLNDYVITYDVSARVYADRPVVCKRAMYGPGRG